MADAVTSQTLIDGPQTAVMKFTNVSDGSGEDAVKKVDVSALSNSAGGLACTGVVIEKMWWQCIGMKVKVLFVSFWHSSFFSCRRHLTLLKNF